MAMTQSQYNQIKSHPNLAWLKAKASRGHAVHQDTIRSKISEAIRSKFPDRITEDNIAWVASEVGTPYGNVMKPEMPVEGLVVTAARSEVEGNDPAMAQAVRMVFAGTATGRSAPGTTGINHIHVGGNAQLNLLFDTASGVVLGVVNGHMDKGMSPSVRSQADKVMSRRGGQTVTLRVHGSRVSA